MNIKKSLCVLMIICTVFSMSGCRIPGEVWHNPNLEGVYPFVDVMTGERAIEEWHENNFITRVKWQELKLSEYHSAVYSKLSAAFDEYNKNSHTQAKALMYDFEAAANELSGDQYAPAYCEGESRLYAQRADKNLVSMLEKVYVYAGGIHPDYFMHGINYDPATGAKVALTDVLKDTKDLPSILEKKITEKYPEVKFYNLSDTFGKYKPEEFTWTLDYQGITFWFAPYDIAAYVVGALSAKIWFDEYPDMFNEKYTECPENYIMALPLGLDVEFDLVSDDGVKDYIYTETVPDKYNSYNMLSVTVNGNTFTDEINYAYGFDVYLVHKENKNYIYSESITDNDYHMFCTWNINGETPEMVQELYGTKIDGVYDEQNGIAYKQVINDPSTFGLETGFDLLGTRGGTAYYEVDAASGIPRMISDAYTFSYGQDVITAIPLEAQLLPDMEKTEIPAGTLLSPYQTDGKSFIDLKTEDGKTVRLNISISDWRATVNGMPEEECFEELLYAG